MDRSLIQSHTPNMGKPVRRAIVVVLVVVTLLAVGAIVAMASTYREASSRASEPISAQEATADAMKMLPNNGAAYTLVAVQLEPTSQHFEFSDASRQGFGEDHAQECLVIPPLPPLPFLTPCRYYPVWVVDLTSQDCNVVIAINALTGRFGGGGNGYRGTAQPISAAPDSCAISPGGGDAGPRWWEASWG
jgi:hypothetical protein